MHYKSKVFREHAGFESGLKDQNQIHIAIATIVLLLLTTKSCNLLAAHTLKLKH